MLEELESGPLYDLLKDESGWHGMLIDYEPPKVERLWRQLDADHRLYLHRIHACEEALFHPHPWPSVVRVLSGFYEMGVGYGRGDFGQDHDVPPVAATMRVSRGAAYEMVDPHGWHYVRPLTAITESWMITGTPWGRSSPGKGIAHPPLPQDQVQRMLHLFQDAFSSLPRDP